MKKIRSFLGIFASLLTIAMAGNAYAADDYTCPGSRQYTSCKAGYYMTKGGVYNGTSVAGNDCTSCPAGYYCEGGTADKTACPINTYRSVTQGTAKTSCIACGNGKYSTAGSTSCKDVEVTISGTSLTYDGTEKTCGAVTVISPSSNASVKYRASTTDLFTGSQIKKTNAGEYTIEYQVLYSGNVVKQDSYTCTIATKEITASASDKTLEYNGTTNTNGTAQSCANVKVSVPSSGATVTYSTSSTGPYITTAPTLTNVGSTTVYYKVTASNFTENTGSYECTMAKKNCTITVKEGTTTIADDGTVNLTYPTAKTLTATASNGATVSLTSGTPANVTVSGKTLTPVKVGSSTITASASELSNFNTCPSVAFTATVKPGTMDVTVTDVSKTYDKTKLTCAGVTVKSPTNATIKYGTTSGTYIFQNPITITNVKDSGTIYYQVTATNYATKNGKFECTIYPANNPVTVSPEKITLTYPDTGAFTINDAEGIIELTSDDEDIATATLNGTLVTVTPHKVGETAIEVDILQTENSNYRSDSRTVLVEVLPGHINAISSDVSKEYDGTELVCNGVMRTAPTTNSEPPTKYCLSKTGAKCTPNSETVPTVTNVADSGTVYFAIGDDNYEPTTGNFQCTVTPANMHILSHDVSKQYDGQSLTCDGVIVRTPNSGANIKYGTFLGIYNLYSAPSITNVKDSRTIYYQVTATNYQTTTGQFECTVTKADNPMTLSANTLTLKYPQTGEITLNDVVGEISSPTSANQDIATATLNGTKVTVTPHKVGETIITVGSAGDDNHSEINLPLTVTVTPGDIEANANVKKLVYTGSEQSCANVVVTSPAAPYATVTYSTTETGTYKGTIGQTNPGTYTIYYKVNATNYAEKTGSYLCTINRVAVNPTSGSIAYRPGDASTTTNVEINTGGGTITATSDNENIATGVSGNTITMISNGKVVPSETTITVTSAANGNYAAATTTYTLNSVTCGDRYYNNDGVCTACPENASACGGGSNPNTFTCDDGYQKNAAGDGCEPKEFTVTYNCGAGGTGEQKNDTTKPKFDAYYTPLSNYCSKTGYDFVGWSVSGTTDTKSAKNPFVWKYLENKTFTANWNAIGTYSANYSCGEGTGSAPQTDTNITYNAQYTVKANTGCERRGYTFAGWNDGSKTVQPGNITWVYDSSMVTFTAQWTANKYELTYSCGSGSGTPPTGDQITFNTQFTLANSAAGCVAPTGYEFVGWIDDSAEPRTPGQTLTWTWSANRAFNANWKPKCLAITVDSQDATTNAQPATVYLKYATGWYSDAECKTPIIALSQQPQRTGHNLDGFYNHKTSASAAQVIDSNGAFIVTTQTKISYSDNGTMYARWTPATYTISYTLNNGTQAASGVPTSYTYGTGASITGQPTRNNYLFDAWCTNSALTENCRKTQTISTTETGNKAFYAKWASCPANATCTGNNDFTCDENYTKNEETRTCTLGALDCVAGKYYPGTGTEMVDCLASDGYYCPGTGTAGIGAGVACRVACPTSKGNGTLTTSSNNATDVRQCVETLVGVLIPKDEEQKNGVANTKCKYSNGTDGDASYERDCDFTVTSCNDGYYVAVKDGDSYSKFGRCDPVGKGYYRAGGECNINPTIENDTCMRNACPTGGTTAGETSSLITQCYISCATEYVTDGDTTVGSKTPVATTLNYSGSAYPECTYNLACADGYDKKNDGTATATCDARIVTVTLNHDGGTGGTTGPIYAKYNHGWYSNAGATSSLTEVNVPTKTNFSFAGYEDADGNKIINADGTFVESKPTLMANVTLNAVWHGVPVPCVAGKRYTGVGTTMEDCRSGEYCPGDDTAFQGTAGCFVKCPTSPHNGALSSSVGATSVSQCVETLVGVLIPKDEAQKNGVANTKCKYSNGTDGNASYERECDFTVTSCNDGYYVAVKDSDSYSKFGRCDPVGKGYYRAGGECNIIDLTSENDTCMRNACPAGGTTADETSASANDCFIECQREEITSDRGTIGMKNPVTDAEGNSRAWLISGTENYQACKYNASCADGYVPEPANSESGSVNATCVVGEGWSVTYSGEGTEFTLPGNPIRNFNVATTDRTLPTNAVRTGYNFVGWYENASLTGDKLTSIPADRQSAIVLYSAWTPNVYPVTVDSANGTATKVIYMKYATGWYSDAAATTKIETMIIPDGSGDTFGGYYYNDTEAVNSSGQFVTNTLAPSDNMTIVAKWLSQPIQCPAGTYYPGTGGEDNCKPCEDGYYCEGKTKCDSNNGVNYCGRTPCPGLMVSQNVISTGGITGATVVTQCINNNVLYTSDDNHVKSGTATCPANADGVYNYDTATCSNHNVTQCVAGYYRDSDTAANLCKEVGHGYWSNGSGVSRTQCETGTIHVYHADGVAPETSTVNGTTEGTTSSTSTACYLENVPFAPDNAHGKGTQTCTWNGFTYSNGCTSKVIRFCDGGYYRENATDTECVPAGADRYSTDGSLISEPCPTRTDASGDLKQGETATTGSGKVMTASSPQACLLRVSYFVPNGDGTQLCEFNPASINQTTGEVGQYDKNCNDAVIVYCKGGYYRPVTNEGTPVTDACVPVGKDYYRPANMCIVDDCARIACPNYTATETETSTSIADCIMETCDDGYTMSDNGCVDCPVGMVCNGGETKSCSELTAGQYPKSDTGATSANQCYRDCELAENASTMAGHDYYNKNNPGQCTIASCKPGYTLSGGKCVPCSASMVCNGSETKSCSELTAGKYTKSDTGATSVNQCYRDCTLAAHATSMTGRDYYGDNQCEIVSCEAGYILSNGKCQACPEGSYCPTDDPADMLTCPAEWSFSDGHASKKENCYRKCESYKVTGGTAVPINTKEYWPAVCRFTGKSDNGNECDIIDGVCKETVCTNIYEFINGECVPCNREHALSYLPTGNCMVASCEIGYHPNVKSCESDIRTCYVSRAVRASQKWDSKLGSFTTCTVEECEEGYHIASNACVPNEQVCAVEHGVGVKEWNSYTNAWGECRATSCDAGYTNDPTETNEHSKQCGQCKNRFSTLGEVAASTYIRGCEIAACLYQGELYNLENNECVPICEVKGYEDETGTRKWDASRKKCVRTCKEGYTMW